MQFEAHSISVKNTGQFSPLVCDYLGGADVLGPFYSFRPNAEGVAAAISERRFDAGMRKVLTEQLRKQYAAIPANHLVWQQIALLEKDNTFTICTAHQPNLLTGHLYFVYKILHAIKLAEELNSISKDKRFVPVFYIGSEDADLDELGTFSVDGKQYRWQTEQQGAVGRMLVDEALMQLLDELEGQIGVQPHGMQMISLLRKAYVKGRSIELCTFQLVHELFGSFGLLILMPDNAALKRSFLPIIQKELSEGFSHAALTETIKRFPSAYNVQAEGREINLFYLGDQLRERIERADGGYRLHQSNTFISSKEMDALLNEHPERFSPNVILRPVYQEWILPNVAFIGGGGELAYWLELKKVFNEAGVFFPPLILRNSFAVLPQRWSRKFSEWDLNISDLFLPENELVNKKVNESSSNRLHLQPEQEQLNKWFEGVKKLVATQDQTLGGHVDALQAGFNKKLNALEKKLQRAARKRESTYVQQIRVFHQFLFPGGVLQERVDNIFSYLSIYGFDFLEVLLQHSTATDQHFTVLMEQ